MTITVAVFLPVMFVLTRLEALPRSTLLINWFVLIALLGAPRLAYRLFRIDQVPQREIATRLDISVSAVEKLLQRAYRRLHALADGGDDD